MTLPAWVDGELLDAATARVSALDLGLRSGIGVFETLRVRAGATFRLAQHLERARTGADALGITVDTIELATAVDVLLDEVARRHERPRDELDDLVLRLTVTAGPVDAEAEFPPPAVGRPTRLLSVHPAPALPLPPARAVTVEGGRALATTKTTSYAAAHRAMLVARTAGADVALLVEGDHVVEAANGNVLALHDDVLMAPPVGEHALPGITRAAALELVRSRALPGVTLDERPLTRAELVGADAVLISSAVAGLREVAVLDGVAIGANRHDADGTVAADEDRTVDAGTVERLRAAFDALVRREAEPRATDALVRGQAGPQGTPD